MKYNYVRATIDNQIVISAVDSKSIVSKAIVLLDLSPVAAEALGRTLTVAALMGKQLKNPKDYMSVSVNGGGVLGTLTACSDAKGNVKGTVANPHTENMFKSNGSLDVARAVGNNGKITVVKDIGLKQPYVGTSALLSGEIAEDFANYFVTSEQQPCALTIGLNLKNGKCKAGGGVFVQVLPHCNDKLLYDVETTLYAMDEMSYQFDGNSARQVVEKFFASYRNFEIIQEGVCRYKCNCSDRRIRQVIKSIGEQEAVNICNEMGYVEVQCHFCNKKYRYDKEQIEQLFATGLK
ncbi:MAG: Hsp33 family molecular chaperone HslO [Corallococcus sp.]|nr:Hsp33 family molecular chaperone HslO [Corallococcus sp.]